ncbi:Gr15 [Eciton burchellii]|nr:Gr15 [Eciton burchellii]
MCLRMVMTSMPTIQQALRPLSVTCFIVGLNVYPFNGSRSRIGWSEYLSLLYCLTVWFVYGYILYYVMIFFSLISLLPYDMLYTMLVNIPITITSVIVNIYHDKRFEMCMQKLDAVNNTLEELGTTTMHCKMHILSKGMVIGWIICSLILNFSDLIWWLNKKEIASWGFLIFLFSHLFNYCLHVNMLMDLLFIIILWYVGTMFDKVNQHMRYLLVKEERRCEWNISVIIVHRSIDNYKRMLWTSIHLHLELCRIARELNLIFGIQMTLQMGFYLQFLVSLCSILYKSLMQKYQEQKELSWFLTSLWTFVFVSRLYATNYTCENASIKANEIDEIIHQLASTPRYADVSKEIYQFTLQLMHRPLIFDGIGLFHFGNRLLRKFCMTIATFVIIIIQMS